MNKQIQSNEIWNRVKRSKNWQYHGIVRASILWSSSWRRIITANEDIWYDLYDVTQLDFRISWKKHLHAHCFALSGEKEDWEDDQCPTIKIFCGGNNEHREHARCLHLPRSYMLFISMFRNKIGQIQMQMVTYRVISKFTLSLYSLQKL